MSRTYLAHHELGSDVVVVVVVTTIIISIIIIYTITITIITIIVIIITIIVMQAVTLQALEAVSARLRDKKLAVRKEAALQLAAVFRFVLPTTFALWVVLNGQAIYALCAVLCSNMAKRRLMLLPVPDKCPPHDAIMLNQAIKGFKQFGSSDLASRVVRQSAQEVGCSLCC